MQAKYNFDKDSLVYEPVFFDLKDASRKAELSKLMASDSEIIVHDDIESQIRELIKLKNPKTIFDTAKMDVAYADHISGIDRDTYGVWVYYSWNKSLVHVLEKEDFITVRTNRNRYKITDEEQARMRGKKVGVIGLSVGQSVAMTLAMERSCEELRLCDFDVLELSNYNRIRTKLTNLGLRKTVSVAREILEMDPFLTIKCFHDGLTFNNIDAFFLEGGKLDICIDECDGVDMKIQCRIKAREFNIPVVMEASDNCTIDVERFDLEKNRPLLHGYIDHLDINKAAHLKTNDEKVPYMLAILSPEFMTGRMLASMFEIKESITTWPQLASSVTYGGGITASVCRRILLGTFTESGRYQLNVDTYFGNRNKNTKPIPEFIKKPKVTLDEMLEEILPISKQEQASKLQPHVLEIVTDGGKAPSGGNLQPWLWHYTADKGLFQFIDKSQQSPLLDHNYVASLIGLGASAENVVLSAQAKGINLKPNFLADDLSAQKNLISHFEIISEAHPFPELAKSISERVSNRKLGERKPLTSDQMDYISKTARSIEGADLTFITDEARLNELAEIFAKVELARITDEQGHKDFMDEIRWSEKEEAEAGDGVNVMSLDIDNNELAGLLACKQRAALELIRKWGKGDKMVKMFRKSIDAASAIGLISMPSGSNKDLFNGGRALQRVWLAATSLGLAFQPQSPATLLFYRLNKGGESQMDSETKELLNALEPRFKNVFSLDKNRTEFFMFRLAITDKKAVKSYRRDPKKLLTQ